MKKVKLDREVINLVVDNLLLDLITDYHDVTHSEVINFYDDLIHEAITREGNIANDQRCPKFMFKKKGKDVWNTVKPSVLPVKTTWNGTPIPHNHVWVIRGFYPNTKIPSKVSMVLNREMNAYFCKVTLGDKNKTTRFDSNDIGRYQNELADAILLDKDIKSLDPIKYKKCTFRCMKPKGMSLLKKGE